MARTLTYRLQRFRDRDGRTLFFAIFLGTRQRGWKTFKPHEVPDFEGETADVRVEKRAGQWIIPPAQGDTGSPRKPPHEAAQEPADENGLSCER